MEVAKPFRPCMGFVLAVAALFATTLKVLWALHSAGSCDTVFFFQFGQALDHATLAQTYASNPMFNHTPATGLLVRWLYRGCRADYPAFAAVFRLLEIAADLGVIAALLYVRQRTGRPPWWALVVFAASPVSIMVSGFHGNVDPLMVLFLTGATVALMAGRPALSGALFGAACNVKVMPLLFAPAFLAYWFAHDRRALLRFTATSGLVLALGSAVMLLECPVVYVHKVFGYGSYWSSWGITYWLRETGFAPFQKYDFQDLTPEQNLVVLALKVATVVGVIVLAWRRRGVSGPAFFTTLAAAFAVVFALAPGAGPQYLVWAAPFVLWSRPGWYAAITVCSALFMAAFYHPAAQWHFPWDFANPNGWEYIFWGPWTNLPWGAFVLMLALKGRRWWRAEEED